MTNWVCSIFANKKRIHYLCCWQSWPHQVVYRFHGAVVPPQQLEMLGLVARGISAKSLWIRPATWRPVFSASYPIPTRVFSLFKPREITIETLSCPDPHYERQRKKFKMLSLIGIPIVLFASCIILSNAREKEKTYKRPDPWIPYSYLVIRRKKFPWGDDRSFFHNPHKNRLPSGWDDEID